MAAEETVHDSRAATEASQQGRSEGDQGTGPSSDPGCETNVASPFRSPSPARQTNQLPDQAQRPSPQSLSLLRSYGSNLPTSHSYINLSTRGSLPRRPAADMGMNRCDTSTWLSPEFSRSVWNIRTPPQLRCSLCSKPYLPARCFQRTRTFRHKRKLFPDLPTASPGHFGLPRPTILRGHEWYAIPLPGSRIGTRFPFARRVC